MWARFAAELLSIAAAFAVASLYPHWLVWWLCALVIGTRQHALAIIGHWASHRIVPGSRSLAWLCFAPLGMSPAKFQANHWKHHRDVGGPTDPEVEVVRRYGDRWRKPRLRDSLLDVIGFRADEVLELIRLTTTPWSIASLAFALAAALALFGWIALLWPAGTFTGLMFAHRLRARTEHDHWNRWGVTIRQKRPSLLKRAIYLPHHTWMHFEHHARPGSMVWRKAG